MTVYSRRLPRLPTLRQRWQPYLLGMLALPLLGLFVVPLLALVARTGLATLLHHLTDAAVTQAVLLSLATSLLATLVTIVLGTPLAYLLARYDFRGRGIIETLIELPMVLPPAVAGVALLMAFGRRGVLGMPLDALGFELAFTPLAVVLAQMFVAAPFYVKAAIVGFTRVAHDAEEAARIDGAGSWQVFRHITLPLTLPALLGGAIMTWARALGEFGATIIFAGNLPGRTQTMPLAIYIGFELALGTALTLAVLLLGVSFGVLAVVKSMTHQRVAAE